MEATGTDPGGRGDRLYRRTAGAPSAGKWLPGTGAGPQPGEVAFDGHRDSPGARSRRPTSRDQPPAIDLCQVDGTLVKAGGDPCWAAGAPSRAGPPLRGAERHAEGLESRDAGPAGQHGRVPSRDRDRQWQVQRRRCGSARIGERQAGIDRIVRRPPASSTAFCNARICTLAAMGESLPKSARRTIARVTTNFSGRF